mmetsp:Transcript_104694/g.312714  ORF Transcript_104694/g.312714 Transcript_104694/m.312714 type:complete len:182 (+) Transcript_104694:79-624(+)
MAFESDLLMWKNPAKTGAALACFNALFFFAVYVEGSLVPLFCNLLMTAIFIGGAVKFAAPGLSEQTLTLVPAGAVEAAVESTAKAVNMATSRVQEAVMWSDSKNTLKALVALEVARRVAPWVSISLLFFLGGNGLFVVPRFLEAKKDVIEKSLGPHIKKAYAFRDDLLAKVPKYTDVVKDE